MYLENINKYIIQVYQYDSVDCLVTIYDNENPKQWYTKQVTITC